MSRKSLEYTMQRLDEMRTAIDRQDWDGLRSIEINLNDLALDGVSEEQLQRLKTRIECLLGDIRDMFKQAGTDLTESARSREAHKSYVRASRGV